MAPREGLDSLAQPSEVVARRPSATMNRATKDFRQSPATSVGHVVAGDELVEIGTLQRIDFQREVRRGVRAAEA